jgi:hypothetical protein
MVRPALDSARLGDPIGGGFLRSTLRFLSGARDIADFFPASDVESRTGKKSFVQIKDRLRCSALPLKPAGKLCSRIARGRAVRNLLRLAEPFRFCQPQRHLLFVDSLTLSEQLALGKWVTQPAHSSARLQLERIYQTCSYFATRTAWPFSQSLGGRTLNSQVVPVFAAS